MESVSQYILFITGLAVVLIGAELFIRSTVKVASTLGLSRFIIGLTIAAFGTSAPEIAIGIIGVFNNTADIGLGNIVGSNIFNILFVLGLGALIQPITINQKTIQRDIPILLGISVLFYLLTLDHTLGLIDASILTLVLAIYLYYLFKYAPDKTPQIEETKEQTTEQLSRVTLLLNLFLLIVSIALLAFGSHWLVTSATVIATHFGISELTIGLTIVAVGTSIPEIATTLAAVRKKEYELAIGNIIGSCIINIIIVPVSMIILTFSSLSISEHALTLDLPIMIATVIVCLPIFFTGHRISRLEGILFLGYYAMYILLLYLNESANKFILEYKFWFLTLIILMITATLIATIVHAIKYKQHLDTKGVKN